jgi:3-oxoadipate enol-lactonase
VLLHSGVTDPREWDAVRPLLEPQHRVVTPDLWREGKLVDVVLDAIPGERAALVGTSFGGRGALEAASAAPARVEALVLVNTNPFGWSDAVRAIGAEEEALFEAGKFDAAATLMVRAWLVGPRRSEDDVPVELRERVVEMQRRAYELRHPEPGPFDLGAVEAPTLFIRSALDWPDVELASQRFERAEQIVLEECAHLPALERPEELAVNILAFLSGVNQGRQA